MELRAFTPLRAPGSSRFVAIGLAVFICAAVIRIAGGWNDLWLDEIWTLDIAGGLSSPLQVFTGVHHDNNHYLNTLWVYAAGDRGNWFGYRVPSLIAGIATVGIAASIGRRRSGVTALFAMAVVGASFPLVLYASEARGYAASVFFALLCFDLLERQMQAGGRGTAAGYAVAAILGLVSHLMFASVVLAGLAWTLERIHREQWPLRKSLVDLALCHLPPLAALALLYVIDIRYISVGGGTTTTSWIDSYGTALAWSLGAPMDPRAQLVASILATVVLLSGLGLLARERHDARLFCVGVILVFPVSIALSSGSNIAYPRYFLLAIAFLVLLLGFVLATLFERGGWRRVVACVALAGFLFANGLHVAQLLRHGRGRPTEVLQLLAERSPTRTIVVGGDHDFRIGTVLAFHARGLPASRSLEYRPRDAWPPEGPEWVITSREPLGPLVAPAAEIRDAAGHRYALEAIFPAAALSGIHWIVYRNVTRP